MEEGAGWRVGCGKSLSRNHRFANANRGYALRHALLLEWSTPRRVSTPCQGPCHDASWCVTVFPMVALCTLVTIWCVGEGHFEHFRVAGVERPSNVIHEFAAMHISSWLSTTPIPDASPPHSLCLSRMVGGCGSGTCGPVPLLPPTPTPHLPPGGYSCGLGWKAVQGSALSFLQL